MQIQGYFDLRFEAVREAFAGLFAEGRQRGAAVCVQVGGETVVDLWAGMADNDEQQPWHADTLVNLFSCTKTFAAVAALQLVEAGKLELDAPVARVWPEFAANGKAESPCASSSAIRPGCRPSALRCHPKRSTTGTG